MKEIELKCSCHNCKVIVETSIAKHFTAKDGRILCDKCSVGVEPASDELKQKLVEIELRGAK